MSGQANSNPDQIETNESEQQSSHASEQAVVKKVTLIIATLCLLILTWYLVADRVTPFTDNSRIRAYVNPLSSSVAGRVIELPVENNQIVKQGQVVARIDPERYEFAVNQAEAALELAGQEVGAKTAGVSTAQAYLVEAITNQNLVQIQVERVLSVGQRGFVSRAEIDKANTQLQNARSEVDKAQAELERAKIDAGISGNDNPRIKKALAELLQARVNLEDTVVRAPRLGLVVNVRYDTGLYVNPGQPLMTYISTKDTWIEAYLRENNLENIQTGNQVEIVFDSAPGRVFKGTVNSVGYGVQFEPGTQVGGLQVPVKKSGWLREAQLFPVIIDFAEEIPPGIRREGGQADIIVYTSDTGVMYWLGKAFIHLMGLLSYVY
ncbi:secretion protein [Photobacterium proteolyticum]|uniref:Secretion protein n=1 Tax=Photobacterium proteolyticum TaxID=1903952 RepID=A0A1Q9H1Y8_9GAMM|nr:HlyD family secretion protein [Photobacterium proteolyticum]OLQ81604.1 secretion protein [Photobacterium proteolyticum]